MGSVPGSLVGALFIATLEVLGTLWLPGGIQTFLVFAALMALLVLRPQGFMGRRVIDGAR